MRLYSYLKTYANLTKSALLKAQESHQIKVNGNFKNLSYIIREGDIITYQDRIIEPIPFVYYAYNKPKGLICMNNGSVASVIKHLNFSDKMFCVGRLDKDTEGLLILTNDGKFAGRVLDKESRIEKVYEATLKEEIKEEDLAKMSGPILIKNKLTLPAKISKKLEKVVEVRICEGKYHQVKKIIKEAGYTLCALKRTKIGSLELRDLLPDTYIEINPDVVFDFQKMN